MFNVCVKEFWRVDKSSTFKIMNPKHEYKNLNIKKNSINEKNTYKDYFT